MMRAIGVMVCLIGGNIMGFAIGDPAHSIAVSLAGLVVSLLGGIIVGLAD